MAAFPSTAGLTGIVTGFEGSDSNVAAQWFPTDSVLGNVYEFDVVGGNRTKAEYRLPDAAAGTQKLTTKVRKRVNLPTLREKKMLKESTLRWLDAAGSHSPERAETAIAREMLDLDDIIMRTHEYQRWQLLTTGKITLTGEYDDVYDFGIGTEADAAILWSEAGTCDPVGDMITWKQAITQKCGRVPTDAYMSTETIKLIFESTLGLNLLSEVTRDQYFKTGKVAEMAGMNIHLMEEGYLNAAGVWKRYLSSDGAKNDMILLKVPGEVGLTAEGGVVDSDAPSGHTGKFAKSWTEKDPSGRWVLEAHTCLPGLTWPNRIGCFTILA